jgi:hypothetical protein
VFSDLEGVSAFAGQRNMLLEAPPYPVSSFELLVDLPAGNCLGTGDRSSAYRF